MRKETEKLKKELEKLQKMQVLNAESKNSADNHAENKEMEQFLDQKDAEIKNLKNEKLQIKEAWKADLEKVKAWAGFLLKFLAF